MLASIQQSHFHVSLVLLPGLWHRRNCLVKKQSAVGSLIFDFVTHAMAVKVSKSLHVKALILKFTE